MATKYYAVLTNVGAAKLANATALGAQVEITQMAVGDGNGVLPTPNPAQTALVHELRRKPLNSLSIDPNNANQIIAEQVIPENEGGWWIREVGLFDESGALIAVGNCPESYKPQLAEGSGRTQTVRMVLITSSTDNITLKIDPAIVLATRKYVDDKALELKVYVDDLMAKHLAAPDPHSQYAPKASPTFTGTPKAPTPAAGNNTTQVATTAFVQAALTALINGAPATLDTLKEIAAAINNDPIFSPTINNALAQKAPLSSPALTGTPTAPTAAQSVNNTQIATTAFVKSAIAAMVGSAPAALDTLNELAAALGVKCYDSELINETAKASGFAKSFVETHEEHRPGSFLYSLVTGGGVVADEQPFPVQIFQAQSEVIRTIAARESCVFVGRCADYVLRDDPNVALVNLFVHAPLAARIRRESARTNTTPAEAEKRIRQVDKERAAYYNFFSSKRWGDAQADDLCVNTDVLEISDVAKLVLRYPELPGLR